MVEGLFLEFNGELDAGLAYVARRQGRPLSPSVGEETQQDDRSASEGDVRQSGFR
jgi:hypothetical protein